jgi:hypothetical protein
MAKNILIFADGTANEGGLLPDESRTNVYKLYRATRVGPDSIIDPSKQLAFYISGIGTPTPGGRNTRWAQIKEIAQQMFGFGLTQKIIDCYVCVVSVWEPGDRIYLFGFSRGAYTARCVSHVLQICGIPTKEPGRDTLNFDPKSLRKVAKKGVGCLYILGMPIKWNWLSVSRIVKFRKAYSPQMGSEVGALAYLVGIWDSVAAIGWQRFFPDWAYDFHFSKEIRYARHLQSIDEGRKDFRRVEWGGSGSVLDAEQTREPKQFDQIWFAGNHADIGGNYPENESRLSDVTLKWMVDFISQEIEELGRVMTDPDLLRVSPAFDGMMHDECMVGVGGTALKWDRAVRDVPKTAQLHDTVYKRLALKSVRNYTSFGPYRPAALRDHEKAKAFYEAAQI